MNYKRRLLSIALIAFAFNGLQAEDTTLAEAHRPVVYMVGDSTMANKPDPEQNPMEGWGEELQQSMQPGVEVRNHATDGRSTRSFTAEGRWERVLEALEPGDWVIIQFGHNDQKEDKPELYTDPETDYRVFLEKFIQETREKGAHPILVTSIYRRYFRQGKAYNTVGGYPQATREVAESLEVPMVDLNLSTGELLDEYGEEGSIALFVHFEPGENAYYPEGRQDNSHLTELGAQQVAALFVAEVLSLDIGFPANGQCACRSCECL